MEPMDVVFKCPACDQELEVDAAGAGTKIECPSCGQSITIPAPTPQNVHPLNPMAASAAAKEEKHFTVPVHDHPSEVLIEKPLPTLEVAAKETDKKVRTKTVRRVDCLEVGKDHFDEKVSEFLGRIGQENIISVNTVSY